MLIPDSDAWRVEKRFEILAGFYAFGMELSQRGASVVFVKLPELHGVKRGLDDWLVAEGDAWNHTYPHLERIALDDPCLKPLAKWWQGWIKSQHVPVFPVMPTPISLAKPAIPEFPLHVFPSWLDDMVEAVAAHTETSRDLAAMLALAVLATCCQKKFCVQVDANYGEPLNLWTVAALESGNRKTAVMQTMIRPLLDWEHERMLSAQDDIARTKSVRATMQARVQTLRQQVARKSFEDNESFEEASREIADLEGSLPDIPSTPRLWTQDITPECLGSMMADQGGQVAILSDEGGLFDILAGRYSNGIPNLDIFLQGHAGSPVRVDRGSRPSVFMRAPALTIGLCPQPGVLTGLVHKAGFRDRGLLARFLYALPLSNLGFRTHNTKPVPPRVSQAYTSHPHALLEIILGRDEQDQPTPYRLTLSAEAHEAQKDFSGRVEFDMREGNRFESLRDWAGKLPGAALRVAGLLHCAYHAEQQPWQVEISEETLDQALTMMEYLSVHAIAVFDLMGADASLDGARRVWRWIERNRRRSFSFRDCHQDLRSSFPRAADLEPALKILQERFYVAPIVKALIHPIGRAGSIR